MNNTNYIGSGHNPDGLDLPVGFSMKLAQEPEAMEHFIQLSTEEKNGLVRYMQEATTGEESEHRVMESIRQLRGDTLL